MKKVVIGLTVLALLGIGAVAFAHGPGWGGNMGYGNGGYMMGPGSGHMYGYGAMMGWFGGDQKFLDETKDLRKELHEKRFEYMEAVRNPETDEQTVTKLEKEITELQDKLYAQAPRTARGFGHGPCWQ